MFLLFFGCSLGEKINFPFCETMRLILNQEVTFRNWGGTSSPYFLLNQALINASAKFIEVSWKLPQPRDSQLSDFHHINKSCLIFNNNIPVRLHYFPAAGNFQQVLRKRILTFCGCNQPPPSNVQIFDDRRTVTYVSTLLLTPWCVVSRSYILLLLLLAAWHQHLLLFLAFWT